MAITEPGSTQTLLCYFTVQKEVLTKASNSLDLIHATMELMDFMAEEHILLTTQQSVIIIQIQMQMD